MIVRSVLIPAITLLSAWPALAGTPAPFTPEVIIGPGHATELGAGIVVEPLGGTINAAGDVAFFARLSGAGITGDNNETVWIYQDGELQLIMRTGRPAAGTDLFTTYSDLYGIDGFTDDGRVGFTAELAGPSIDSTNATAFWFGDAASLPIVLRAGDMVPGLDPGQTVRHVSSNMSIASNGVMSIPAFFDMVPVNNPIEQVIITGTADNLAAFVSSNGQVTPGGMTFVDLNLTNPSPINAQGQVFFFGTLPSGQKGIFLGGPQEVQTIALDNAQVPGQAAGVLFEQPSPHAVSAAGWAGFRTAYIGPGINSNNNTSYWLVDPAGNASQLVRERDVVPVRSGTQRLKRIDTVVFNDHGHYAFNGMFDGSPPVQLAGTGVWYGDGDGLELIAQEYDLLPGAEDYYFGEAFQVLINNRNLVVFAANMYELDNSSRSRSAVFAYRDGIVQTLLVEDQLINVALAGDPEDLRRFDAYSFTSGVLGSGSLIALNHNDQFVLNAIFTDDTTALLRFDLTGLFAPGDPGDLTGDGYVGAEDLDVLLANWGRTTVPGSWRDGDADGDGVVGAGDLQMLIDHWSEGTPPGGVVPEPATGVVLASLFVLTGRRRSGRRRI